MVELSRFVRYTRHMSLPKAKQREIVVNLLFSQGFSDSLSDEMIMLLMTRFKTTKKNVYHAIEVAQEVRNAKEKIDPLIQTHCKEYTFDRITHLEKATLRLGFYELFIEKVEPPKVCINEAIRVTKKFGSQESAKFVNAILDEAFKNESSD